MSAPRILVVAGPTATGKTKLGVRLCRELGGEVVSADSMQIYKYMDIGTAKPTAEETEGIPHHMIDAASPFDNYSAALYVKQAAACVDDILSRGKVPVIVGGTGLYIDSLVSGREFAPREGGDEKRRELERQYDELGGEKMLAILAETDRERAEKLHPNDKKRIVRALEIAGSGENMSEHDRQDGARPPKYDASYVILNYESREELYRRIDSRVDVMMERGLESEVRSLLDMGLPRECTAMQAIGYKEMAAALYGECSVEDAVEKIKQGSRRYAKRQITWFGKYDALRINWKNTPDFDEALRVSTTFWRGQS